MMHKIFRLNTSREIQIKFLAFTVIKYARKASVYRIRIRIRNTHPDQGILKTMTRKLQREKKHVNSIFTERT